MLKRVLLSFFLDYESTIRHYTISTPTYDLPFQPIFHHIAGVQYITHILYRSGQLLNVVLSGVKNKINTVTVPPGVALEKVF